MLFHKKSCILFVLIFSSYLTYSQISPNAFGSLSIAEGGFVTIFGHHNFMAGTGLIKPGTINVNRSANPGYLIYSSESSWSGASEMQYIDGFVKSYNNNKFTFPIGHNGQYKPVCLSNSYASSAAYFYENPKNLNGSISEKISNISQVEYWTVNIKQDSKLTLSWSKSSKIENILGNDNLEQLTIIGLNQDNKWEIIPSTIDEYVLNVSLHSGRVNKYTKSKNSLGSITSDINIDAGDYKQFTLASILNSQDLVTPSLNVYPNPQIVGTSVNLKYKSNGAETGVIRIFKSDNSLLVELDMSLKTEFIQLPYFIRESGSYIISITDSNGNTSFENLIVVDK